LLDQNQIYKSLEEYNPEEIFTFTLNNLDENGEIINSEIIPDKFENKFEPTGVYNSYPVIDIEMLDAECVSSKTNNTQFGLSNIPYSEITQN